MPPVPHPPHKETQHKELCPGGHTGRTGDQHHRLRHADSPSAAHSRRYSPRTNSSTDRALTSTRWRGSPLLRDLPRRGNTDARYLLPELLFDVLIRVGLLTLTQPDPLELETITLTKAGQSRYEQLGDTRRDLPWSDDLWSPPVEQSGGQSVGGAIAGAGGAGDGDIRGDDPHSQLADPGYKRTVIAAR
jgi:hypothetical protein